MRHAVITLPLAVSGSRAASSWLCRPLSTVYCLVLVSGLLTTARRMLASSAGEKHVNYQRQGKGKENVRQKLLIV